MDFELNLESKFKKEKKKNYLCKWKSLTNEVDQKEETFLVMDDQENDDQIPDPDEALRKEMVKLEVWKVGRFRDY